MLDFLPPIWYNIDVPKRNDNGDRAAYRAEKEVPMMNLTEKRTHVKTLLADSVAERFPEAVQIGNYEFVVPVTVDGEVIYGTFPIGTKDTRGTKASEKRAARNPFNLDEAVAEWEEEKRINAEIAAEIAAAKAKRNK